MSLIELVLALVPERGETHVFGEMLGERALVAIAQFPRHLADLGALPAQRLACGLDPKFHEKALWTSAECLDEFSMQLTRGKMGDLCEGSHVHAFPKVFPQVCNGASDRLVGRH